MYICMCNPFTDKDVKRALENPSTPNKTSTIYKEASDGQTPCCGTCICAIQDMIVDHQSAKGVQDIKDNIEPAKTPELIDAA